MHTALFRRASVLAPSHIARLSTNFPLHCARIGSHISCKGSAIAVKVQYRRNLSEYGARAQLPQSRPPSQLSVTAPPSVLQLVSSSIWRATHRSGATSSHARYAVRPPPRGPRWWERFRNTVNSIPYQVLFWGVLVLNGVVYASWNYAYAVWRSEKDPSLYVWMRNNFTCSIHNINAGRFWTLVTACFSHEMTGHLFMNAFTYYFMAPPVLMALGNMGFISLYIGGGIVSSLVSLFWHNAVKHKDSPSHGASGAIYSVVTFFACVAPRTQFALFGIVPLPAWLFVSGVFLLDGYSAVYDKQAGTDTAGHIGGILAGIAYFVARMYRIF